MLCSYNNVADMCGYVNEQAKLNYNLLRNPSHTDDTIVNKNFIDFKYRLLRQ